MRAIKFRAWDQDASRMVEVGEVRFYNSVSQPFMVFGERGERIMDICGEFRPEHLMQFTGLHDKNGREIYEGDILAWRPNWIKRSEPPQVVEFSGSGYDPFQYSGGGEWHQADAEIIGNIHENPELLK